MTTGGRRAARVDATGAVAGVRSGDTVFVASAASTPATLVEALLARSASTTDPLSDVTLIHYLTDGLIPAGADAAFTSPFAHRTFFVGREMRLLLDRGGVVDYVPLSVAQIPDLVRSGRLAADVALIQTTPPDGDGVLRFGLGVDIAAAFAAHSRLVVAECNARMPRARGDNTIAATDVDFLVASDRALPTYAHAPSDAVTRQVAAYIGSLIVDGSTLQVGVGQIPNEAMRFLRSRNDLGIHTDLLTDPLFELVEAGIANGRAKPIDRGVAVASYAFGSQRLYDAIDDNPAVAFRSIDRVCAPEFVAAQRRMVSISQVFSIDLTGQACADQFEGRLYGGVGVLPDVLRATVRAPGGTAIVCLASTTEDGRTSRIRPQLAPGDGVTLTRTDVHVVVTEYGIANLFGRSLPERALMLIELADPRFRPWLLEEAKRLGHLPPQQTLASTGPYPVDEERRLTLADGTTLLARPAKASDAPRIRALVHALSEDDVYTRFFRRLSCLGFADTQRLCNVDYEREVAFVVTAGDDEGPLVATASYYTGPTPDRAEVAYMVDPGWQGRGVGRHLQGLLFDYGRRRGVVHFVAEVLRANGRMATLARSSCANVEIERDDDVLTITMTP